MAASSKRPPLSHEEVNCIFLNRYCAKPEIRFFPNLTKCQTDQPKVHENVKKEISHNPLNYNTVESIL